MTRSLLMLTPVILASLSASSHSPLSGQSLSMREVIEAALDNHPTMTAAAAYEQVARGRLGAVRGSSLPHVVLDATSTTFQEPMVVSPIHAFDVRTPPSFAKDLLQGQVSASWTLFDGGAAKGEIAAAAASLEGSQASSKLTEADLILAATHAVASVVALRTSELAQRDRERALLQELERVRRLFESGTTPEVSVLRATASLRSVEAELATMVSRRRLAERNLARLMGTAHEEVSTAEITLSPRLSGDDSENAGMGQDWLSTHPTTLLADSRVAAAEGTLKAAQASSRPHVKGVGRITRFDALDAPGSTEWNVGVAVTFPVFTSGQRGATIRGASAQADRARAQASAARLELEGRADAARSSVDEASARLTALKAAVTQLSEVVRIEALSLEAGMGVQAEYLRAQGDLALTRSQAAQAEAQLATARMELAAALGVLDRDWIRATLGDDPIDASHQLDAAPEGESR